MDLRFIRKVYRSVALTWAVAMFWALAFGKPWIGLSITFGVLLGTAALYTYEWFVRRAFIQGAASPNRALLKLSLLRLPAIGVVLYLLVHWNRISLPAFCGGIVLVHFAILAKALGMMLVERLQADKQRVHPKES